MRERSPEYLILIMPSLLCIVGSQSIALEDRAKKWEIVSVAPYVRVNMIGRIVPRALSGNFEFREWNNIAEYDGLSMYLMRIKSPSDVDKPLRQLMITEFKRIIDEFNNDPLVIQMRRDEDQKADLQICGLQNELDRVARMMEKSD